MAYFPKKGFPLWDKAFKMYRSGEKSFFINSVCLVKTPYRDQHRNAWDGEENTKNKFRHTKIPETGDVIENEDYKGKKDKSPIGFLILEPDGDPNDGNHKFNQNGKGLNWIHGLIIFKLKVTWNIHYNHPLLIWMMIVWIFHTVFLLNIR